MKRKLIGASLLLSVTTPYLCRFPQGKAWVLQYLPNEGILIVWIAYLVVIGVLLLPSIPSVICFHLAKSLNYKLGLLVLFVTIVALIYYHHDNDLSQNNQSALSLLTISIKSSFIALISAILFYAARRGMKMLGINGTYLS